MKNLKIQIFIVLICLATGPTLLGADNSLIEKSNRLATLEIKQHAQLRTWEHVMLNYILLSQPITEDRQSLASVEKYYELSLKKRKDYKVKYSQIRDLEKLVPQKDYLNIAREINKLRQELKPPQENDLEFIKSSILKFNNNEIQIQPMALDYLLGIEYEETETSIKESSDHVPDMVVGHSKFYTQIDYLILREVFKKIKVTKDDIFYDLGSGYGRVSFYGAILFPEGQFKGVEYIKERVDQTNKVAKNLKLENAKFYASDVLKYDYSDGNIFFIFNAFPSIMPQVMEDLKKVAKNKKIKIVAAGNTVIELKMIPWLKSINTVPSYSSKTPTVIFESIN